MKLSALEKALHTTETLRFQLPNGTFVPAHFHLTEIGLLEKKFMDCGGKMRQEQTISIQLWVEQDIDHRLEASKFLNIIDMAKQNLDLPDLEIEVDYQQETLSKFALGFNGEHFILESTHTACLARESCGVPEKPETFNALAVKDACTPGGGCC